MIARYLLNLPPAIKRLILVVIDLAAFAVAMWSAYALRFSEWWPVSHFGQHWLFFAAVPIVSVSIMWWLGLYRTVVRYMELRALRSIAFGALLLICLTYFGVMLGPVSDLPGSVPLIFGLCVWLYVGGSRLVIRELYTKILNVSSEKKRIAIFGAGSAGAQLARLCGAGSAYLPVAFIDDDKKIWNREVGGLVVHSPAELPNLVKTQNIDVVTLAIPSASEQAKLRIIKRLSNLKVDVKTMPTLKEIIAGEPINSIREVAIEGLLGRNAVEPVARLLQQSIKGKNVCITGAGGSIGSELARQALEFGAATVLLYEQSEFSLYSIERELVEMSQRISSPAKIIPLLGSILDRKRLTQALTAFEIETLYHAAAYKHVPIVEHNVIEGIKNNVLGTEITALAAEETGVERFILISTDKAVRPTNAMGASKRVAELILQNMASNSNSRVVYSMVRFGNVLDSSGSVVPVFRKQIKEGSRVTVTHPDITRYFMTISEAATLVIQAGSLAKGGEVFLLDMGKPIKILDLAKTLIRLSGSTVKNDENPDGDIEIEFTGLRPGEKLYEELLVGADAEGTEHPKIMCAIEEQLSSADIKAILQDIREAIDDASPQRLKKVLARAVAGYDPPARDVDWLNDIRAPGSSDVILMSRTMDQDRSNS